MTIAGLLYHWFAPAGVDCSLNVSIITLSLILCIILSLLTMHPTVSAAAPLVRSWWQQPLGVQDAQQRRSRAGGLGLLSALGREAGRQQPAWATEAGPPNISRPTSQNTLTSFLSRAALPRPPCPRRPQVQRGSLFPAACISLYTMYLAYSALQSEPRDYECNALGARMGAASATTLAGGVLLTLCSVVYSAFRAGSNTQTFRCGAAGGGGGGGEGGGCGERGVGMQGQPGHGGSSSRRLGRQGSLPHTPACLHPTPACLPSPLLLLQHRRL